MIIKEKLEKATYITHHKFESRKFRIPTDYVDENISAWFCGISIDAENIITIQNIYQREVKDVTSENKEVSLDQLRRKFQILKEEETKLGRAFITGKISDDAYDELRSEWQEKILNLKWKIKEMEFDASKHLDDLDVALVLLQNIGTLFKRLDRKQKNKLLRIVVK